VTRLLLVRHAPTAATRAAAFPLDEPLDDDGRAAAASLAGALPGDAAAVCSPARRCLQTAAALGLRPKIDARLRECDFGRWAGRTLAELDAEDPAATRAWMLDPAAAPHHGESLLDFHARVGAWLADLAAGPGAVTVAVTHGGVVRSAVTHALNAPLAVMWRIGVPPLSIIALDLGDDGFVTLLERTRPMLASFASATAV
jgi:broad specificity phosphatase PhoE